MSSKMGRKLEFNRAQALDNATKLFWKLGYSETSLKQLLKEMQMGESSFYHTFKSKKSLYLECLNYYNAELMTNRFTVLNSSLSPYAKLISFFEAIADDLDRYQIPGCLSSNSLSSDTLAVKEINDFMTKGLSNFKTALEAVIEQGINDGELGSNLSPEVLSKLMLTYLHGLFRLSAVSFDKQDFIAQSEAFLQSVLNPSKVN